MSGLIEMQLDLNFCWQDLEKRLSEEQQKLNQQKAA